MLFVNAHRLATISGAQLTYHHQAASAPAKGIVVICHGLAEHSRRYQRFAEALSVAGYHVFAHDHRGHGETTAVDAPIGRFARREGWRLVIADTLAMRDFAVERFPGLPVILFGHSSGRVDRAQYGNGPSGRLLMPWPCGTPTSIQELPVASPRWFWRSSACSKGSDVPSLILPRATFLAWGKRIPNRRTDFDWLSHDAAEVDVYARDPLCGFDASVAMWRDVFTLTFRGASHAQLNHLPKSMPIHLVGGGEDPATDNAKRHPVAEQTARAVLGFACGHRPGSYPDSAP